MWVDVLVACLIEVCWVPKKHVIGCGGHNSSLLGAKKHVIQANLNPTSPLTLIGKGRVYGISHSSRQVQLQMRN